MNHVSEKWNTVHLFSPLVFSTLGGMGHEVICNCVKMGKMSVVIFSTSFRAAI